MPWAYPSSSMLYKFGSDRVILSLGKSAGVAAVVLMGLQLFFIARFQLVERIVGYDRIVQAHRLVGIVTVLLALLHPLLVFAVEDVATIPVKWDYWPEVIGGGLLVSLSLYVAFAYWRPFSRVPYHYWKPVHWAGSIVLIGAALVHVYYVTDSYRAGVPLGFILAVGGVGAACWVWMLLRSLWAGSEHSVVSVTSAGPAAREIRLKPDGDRIQHAPGQFAYLKTVDGRMPSEPHPFTIASPPGTEELRFVIRCCGDWTRRISHIQAGDTVRVSGPYGLFSPEAHQCEDGYVCIAGGIGITPMLSMIENMDESSPPLHLIWSNRTSKDAFARPELDAYCRRLPQLHVTYVFSREPSSKNNSFSGRIDREFLAHALSDVPLSKSVLFLCGPESFMGAVQCILRRLGVPRTHIITEVFGF